MGVRRVSGVMPEQERTPPIVVGAREDQVAVPRDRLFGCGEAFKTRTVLCPAAEALQAALRPLQALYAAARQALDLAEAVQLSVRLLNQD